MAGDEQGLGSGEEGLIWKFLAVPHPFTLAILVFAGLLLEGVVHYLFGIPVVYTHVFYLIIVIAGLWYGTRAVWIGIFFGGLHIAVTASLTGALSGDSVLRALMFCIVAFVVGTIAAQLRTNYTLLHRKNLELQRLNASLNTTNQDLELSRIAFETANRKLNLLSSITRHDIHNQLTALLGYHGLVKDRVSDPETLRLLMREEETANNIVRQIEFTKNYEELGVRAPVWQDVEGCIGKIVPAGNAGAVTITARLDGIEVYADPLFEKVLANLMDNTLRHGGHVQHITFSILPYAGNAVALVYEDDGVGIHDEDKERIFEKGFGRHTGLGLFLAREILAITGITIREHGTYGKGARFEILIPEDKYRFPARQA